MPPWMIKSTEWWSQPLAAVWWFTGVVSVCIGSITWYCVQQFIFGGDIPPLSILSVAYRYEVPPSKGDLKIFHCPPCWQIPWSRGWMPGAHSIPWTEVFPLLRFPSWGGRGSSQSSGPQKQCLPRILHGLLPQWLGVWYLVEKISSGEFISCPRVWFMTASW